MPLRHAQHRRSLPASASCMASGPSISRLKNHPSPRMPRPRPHARAPTPPQPAPAPPATRIAAAPLLLQIVPLAPRLQMQRPARATTAPPGKDQRRIQPSPASGCGAPASTSNAEISAWRLHALFPAAPQARRAAPHPHRWSAALWEAGSKTRAAAAINAVHLLRTPSISAGQMRREATQSREIVGAARARTSSGRSASSAERVVSQFKFQVDSLYVRRRCRRTPRMTTPPRMSSSVANLTAAPAQARLINAASV